MAKNRLQFQPGLSMPGFLKDYGTEAQCEQVLEAVRWPEGFRCPRCADTAHTFLLAEEPTAYSNADVRPTNEAPIIRVCDGRPLALPARWGLMPSWAKDAAIAQHTFNARAETIAEKPSFRSAFKRRRCIVPMTAFFE